MLSFSRTTGYAILALSCIGSWKGQRVLAGQIHKCTRVPMPYLEKILFSLARCGLIQSKRGYKGGFILGQPAEEITLLDVVNCVEHEKSESHCLLGLPDCDEAIPCRLRSVWPGIWTQIEAELRNITIAEAAQSVHHLRCRRLIAECMPEAKKPRRTHAEKATGRKKAPRSGRSA